MPAERDHREATDAFYDGYVRRVFGVDADGDAVSRDSLVGHGVDPPAAASTDEVRLFSVAVVNRLLFVKFLEAGGVVDADLLARVGREHAASDEARSLYDAYLDPLFYEVFNARPTERPPHVRAFAPFRHAPYLNRDLFRPTVPREREFGVADDVLVELLDWLDGHDFAAGDGEDGLPPAVLGNVFEKSINHLAAEHGAQRSSLGAYYTPDDIAAFCARESVRPTLFDAMRATLVEERGWRRAEVDRHDDLHAFLDAIDSTSDLAAFLQGVVDEFRVLDPACGSGHFLAAVLDELVAVRATLAEATTADVDRRALTARTATENVYGVDVMGPAVEIARLRLWLAILVADDREDGEYGVPVLPNLAFNVRRGNSLVGLADLDGGALNPGEVHAYAEHVAAAKRCHDGSAPVSDDVEASRARFVSRCRDAFVSRLDDATFEDAYPFDGVDRLAEVREILDGLSSEAAARTSTISLVFDPASAIPDEQRPVLDERGFRTYAKKANYPVAKQIDSAVVEDVCGAVAAYSPAGDVERVVLRRALAAADVDAVDGFHWPAEFPEAVRGASTHDAEFGFDVVIGNPPFGAALSPRERAVVGHDALFSCQGTNHDSAEHFMERAVQLCRDGGRVAFVMPKTVAFYKQWQALRDYLFEHAPPVATFDHGLAFADVDFETASLVCEVRSP